jgi:hypothetical protein
MQRYSITAQKAAIRRATIFNGNFPSALSGVFGSVAPKADWPVKGSEGSVPSARTPQERPSDTRAKDGLAAGISQRAPGMIRNRPVVIGEHYQRNRSGSARRWGV